MKISLPVMKGKRCKNILNSRYYKSNLLEKVCGKTGHYLLREPTRLRAALLHIDITCLDGRLNVTILSQQIQKVSYLIIHETERINSK